MRRLGLLAATVFIATPGFADEGAARATRLFYEAKELVKAGKAPEACPKFEESQKLDPGAGTQFNLADCYEKVGRFASAWKLFRDLEGVLRRVDDVDRAAKAAERARALEARLPRLTISVPWASRAKAVVVMRDGVAIDPREIGTAVPVDPGKHAVTVQATNKKPFSKDVLAEVGVVQTVNVPELEDDAQAGPPSVNVRVEGPRPPVSSGSGRTIGLVVGGAGVAALATGVVLGFVAKGDYDDAIVGCRAEGDTTRCPAGSGGAAKADSAKDLAMIGTIVGGVGAAAIVVGAVLFFTSPKAGSTTALRWRGLELTPAASPTGGGLSLRLTAP